MAGVNIDPIVIPNFHYAGSVFTWRVFSDKSWVALDQTAIPARGDTNQAYQEITLTVDASAHTASAPAVTLAPQTSAPNEKNARYSIFLYIDGIESDMFLANTLGAFQVPDTPATTNWSALEQYNFRSNRRYHKDENTYSRLEIDQKIAASSSANFVDSTTSQKGVGTLSVPAAIPTAPKFAGDNDPRVNSVFDAKFYGCVGDGFTNDRGALNTLVNATMQAVTGGGTVVLSKGDYLLGSGMTFPANVQLKFEKGARLKLSTASVYPILGTIEAGPFQIFTNALAAQGTVTFAGNNSLNLIYPEWWSAIGDNSTDNATMIQAAATAQKTLGGGFGGGTMKFSVGTYLTSAAIQLTEVKGIRWEGSGRIGTVIKAIGTASAVQGNGVWYSTFSQIQFTASGPLASGKAPFELDAAYDGVHTQTVQGNTFDNCLFDGAGSDYAYRGGRQAVGNWQGSENLFLNCHWLRATLACYKHGGFNAIANTFIGGDMQAFDKDGISYAGGSVLVYGTSFESTNAYTQVINGGYDINTGGSGVYEFSIISGCRSESLRFFNGVNSQGAVITGFNWTPAAYTGWAALTPFGLNAIQFKTAPNGSMKAYRASTAGTSGAVEPTWPNSGTVADGSVVWTQFDLNVINLPVGSLISSTGFIGIPLPAGIPGNFLAIGTVNVVTTIAANYTAAISDDTIVGITTGGSFTVTLPDAATTPNPPTGKRMYFKKGTTDANTMSVQATGGNGIDGSAAVIVIPGGSEGFLVLEYDSTAVQWRVIGKSFGTFGDITAKSLSIIGTPISSSATMLLGAPMFLTTGGITTATIGTSTGAFITPGNTTVASDSFRQSPMPPCVVRNLRVNLMSTSPAAGTVVITVRKNGADTAITITIPAGTTTAVLSDLTHSVVYVEGDRLSIGITNNDASNTFAIAGSVITLEAVRQ